MVVAEQAAEAVTHEVLHQSATLFNKIKQLRVKLPRSNVDEPALDRAFDSHIQNVLLKLEERLPFLSDGAQATDTAEGDGAAGNQQEQNEANSSHAALRDAEIVMAKHGLFDAAMQQMILLCQSVSPALGECLKEFRGVHASLLGDLHLSACTLAELCDAAREAKGESRRNEEVHREVLQAVEDENAQLKDTLELMDNEAEQLNSKVLELRAHLREAAQEINHLRESKTAMGAKLVGSSLTFDTTRAIYGEKPSTGPATTSNTISSGLGSPRSVGTTSAGDPRYASAVRKGVGSGSGRFNTEEFLGPNSSVSSPFGSPSPNSGKGTGAGWTIAGKSAGYPGGISTPQKAPLSLVAPQNWLHIFRVDVQRAIDEGRCRAMSQHECVELVEKIYESKSAANDKAIKGVGSLPMETMEQHLYRTMEKKYGLRNLAVDHVGMLVRAVETFAAQGSNYVTVFRKVLRNEVEEDFRLIQQELKKSVRDLCMMSLMDKHPNKDQPALQAMLLQKLNGEGALGIINEDEWRDMVSYLYNEADAQTLCLLLRRLAVAHLRSQSPGPPGTSITVLDAHKSSAGSSSAKSSAGSLRNSGNWGGNVRGSETRTEKAGTSGTGFPGSNVSGSVPAGGMVFVIGNGSVNATARSINGSTLSAGQPGNNSNQSSPYNVGNGSLYNNFAPTCPGSKTKKFGYDKANVKDLKRLGYSSPSLRISVKGGADEGGDGAAGTNGSGKYSKRSKEPLTLPFPVFLETVLGFQLDAHEQYLSFFVAQFRRLDSNVDGVLSASEFRELFVAMRERARMEQRAERAVAAAHTLAMQESTRSAMKSSKGQNKSKKTSFAHNNRGSGEGRGGEGSVASTEGTGLWTGEQGEQGEQGEREEQLSVEEREEEARAFLSLIQLLDPFETDRIIFSSAVACLNKLTSAAASSSYSHSSTGQTQTSANSLSKSFAASSSSMQ